MKFRERDDLLGLQRRGHIQGTILGSSFLTLVDQGPILLSML
jgi:hypothetical protein